MSVHKAGAGTRRVMPAAAQTLGGDLAQPPVRGHAADDDQDIHRVLQAGRIRCRW
ncbi:hypothetical protein [Acrocarpospora macrocephala]|uniref:hypothetical protein n=1 Tax=Acrocarpospora macrocephala TaxID=150177 RepID=UPI001C3FAF76|nr:hypothetical protein [Acrocarpospora macrocephala]